MKITTPSSRVRTSFDPELELPKLHRWFAENPHPSRLTLQLYVKELNSLASRQSRKLLEVHNLCYWFKNARAAYKRAELRMKKNHHDHQHQHNNNDNNHHHDSSKQESRQKLPSQQHQFQQQDASTSSNDTGIESPSRADSISPSSTGFTLATDSTYVGASKVTAAGGGTGVGVNLASQTRQQNQSQIMQLQSNLGNIDLACAVNCLLSTASNFTVAAAAAAAAAAASSTLTTGSISPAANLLQGPSSAAAISLAATLLNSNLIQASSNPVGRGPNSAAAARSPVNSAATASAVALATNPAMAAAALAVDQPMRQLVDTFNPSSYQFALGMLEKKVLDSSVLRALTFPTSACAQNGLIPRYSPADLNTGRHQQKMATNNQHNYHHNRARSNGFTKSND